MKLVGYSNFAQNTLESNAILCVKIFWGKHRSRVCTKKGIYACLVVAKVVETRRRTLLALQLLDLPKHNNNGRTTINNNHTHVECTLMMT